MLFAFSVFSLIVLLSVFQKSAAIMSAETPFKLNGFKYCLREATNQPNLRNCLGRGALSLLQTIEQKHNFSLTPGFITVKDERVSARSFVNLLDTDPVDFRGVLEQAGAVFSQRSLEFHMDTVYPGLLFRIGPSADANSVAEFALDPTVNERNFVYGEPTTARILTKQYVLPLLLGLKFKLAALVPLLLAGICLLLKKSLFLAKFALYTSSVLGIGGAFGTLGGLLGSINGLGGGMHPYAPTTLGGGYFPQKIDSVHNNPYNDNEFKQNFPYKRIDDSSDRTSANFHQLLRDTVKTDGDTFYNFENGVSSKKFHPEELERSNSKWKIIAV